MAEVITQSHQGRLSKTESPRRAQIPEQGRKNGMRVSGKRKSSRRGRR